MARSSRPLGTETAVVAADELTRFTKDVFVRAGMSDAHAGIVADVLVWADLRGVSSHGVARVPFYLRLIAHGPRAILDELEGVAGRLGVRMFSTRREPSP